MMFYYFQGFPKILPRKSKAVHDRVYKTVEFPDFPPKILNGIVQLDLTVTSLFNEDRKVEMENSAREGNGQSFWTTRERNMFHQRFYNTYIKKGKKIEMKRVRSFVDQLCDEYNCFRIALKDKKITTSLYYCLNNLSKNKKYIKIVKSWTEIDFGPLANLEMVEQNSKSNARRYL
jgi:hypothetical protein